MDSQTPPVFRALRLYGLGPEVLPLILDGVDADRAARLVAGTERLPVSASMFLVLFAAAWSSHVFKIVTRRPGGLQQAERHLIAADELLRAQDRINAHMATETDYAAAVERWAAFEARGDEAWDTFFKHAMTVSPSGGERVDVMISPDEVRH